MTTIPPFKLIPEPMNDAARALPPFKWADPEAGTRHRLGGEPDNFQELPVPTCSICGEQMSFYAQLDSVNDEFCVADVGLIQVFVCFEHSEVRAQVDNG